MDLKQNPLKTDSSANTIYIEWRREPGHFHNYIIKYRAKDSNDVLAMQTTPESKIQLSNLKTSTSYEIKIFVEDTDGDESLLFKTEVRTVASIASELLKSAEKICNDPITYRLRPVKITKPFENILIHEFCKYKKYFNDFFDFKNSISVSYFVSIVQYQPRVENDRLF